MTHMIYICSRSNQTNDYNDRDIESIVRATTPKNTHINIKIIRNDNSILCLINPSDSIVRRGTSVCLGQIFGSSEGWYQSGNNRPDGSYVIIRNKKNTCELISDTVSSRTIFYTLTNNKFIVSTMQRPIIHFFDDISFSEEALAWMLSSGTLGPQQSWDERLQMVPPNSRICLNKTKWDLSKTQSRITFEPSSGSKRFHLTSLEKTLDQVFPDISFADNQWKLPLSGGIDARELLLRFTDRNISTFTYGTAEARTDKTTDAHLGPELARRCGVPNRFHKYPDRIDDPKTIFNRFLTVSEGRIDHVSGAIDGYRHLSRLSKSGVEGIITANEGFGWNSVATPLDVRRSINALIISDFDRLSVFSDLNAAYNYFPPRYQRIKSETLATWRDRLYHTYRLPYIISGPFTQIQSHYLEKFDPFLSDRILSQVRTLPDKYRTNKHLFSEYVLNRSPPVPVAQSGALPRVNTILSTPNVISHIHNNVDCPLAKKLFGEVFVDNLLESLSNMNEEDPKSYQTTTISDIINELILSAGSALPTSVRKSILRYTTINYPINIKPQRLAFRAYIAVKMLEKFRNDVNRIS